MNFDKNSIFGFVLIALVLVGYGIWQQPTEEEKQAMARQRDSLAQVEKQKEAEEALIKAEEAQETPDVLIDAEEPDSVKEQRIKIEYGSFASAAEGERKFITLENDRIKATFSNQGGKPYTIELKNYKTFDGKPLLLFDGDSTVFGIGISAIGKNTNDLFFEPQTSETAIEVTSENGASVSYRLYADSSSYLEYTYTLRKDDFIMDFEISSKNMDEYIKNRYITLDWEAFIRSSEKGKDWEKQNTTIHYKYFEDEHDYLSSRSKEVETEKLTGKVKWVAFKHHFFSSIIVADEYFLRGGNVRSNPEILSENHVKQFGASLDLAYEQNSTQKMLFYFGPNHYPTLKSYDLDFEKLIDLGWGIFGWVNRFVVIPIFNWLSKFISNYGIIILLLTIIIKIALFPLTFKSYLSTAKMRVLKPEVDKINEKHKNADAMKKQQAVMELYKKAGANPMGGCLPMLIQMPILFAMFRFFPASIELRQKSFLWASDLSTYDSILNLPFDIPWYGSHVSLFTLLMAVSMIFTTALNNKNMTTAPGQPNMKVMMWMMPVMMLIWFNSYSSGLSYYYFIANMITLIQTWAIRKSINDEELLSKLKANTKKPKKKSKFQQRLEEMQRQQKNLKK